MLFILSAVLGMFLLIHFDNLSFSNSNMTTTKLISVEFEVFGRVQGVFFRKFTQQEAKKLGLKGWCMNTVSGTVQGVMEGSNDKINEMKNWLQTVGSPSSKIEKAEFRNEKEILQPNFSNFSVKR
ncbi:hypothetical protein RI129_002621 [Pyrocoelia pectoralis]|uniref:Acylphosphatase n=1 Tax=Pyrocoelia pectoralis TaxID=417401 RepID=A0AAN7VP90_9COLE